MRADKDQTTDVSPHVIDMENSEPESLDYQPLHALRPSYFPGKRLMPRGFISLNPLASSAHRALSPREEDGWTGGFRCAPRDALARGAGARGRTNHSVRDTCVHFYMNTRIIVYIRRVWGEGEALKGDR